MSFYKHCMRLSSDKIVPLAKMGYRNDEAKEITELMMQVHEEFMRSEGYSPHLAQLYQWFKKHGLEELYAAAREVAFYERKEQANA